MPPKPHSRTRHLGARLTEEEYQLVLDAAAQLDQKPSEFCRDLLLCRARQADPVLMTLVEEVVALRIIVQNVIVYLATDGQDLRKDSLAKLAERADQLKAERARGLLTQTMTLPSPRS